MSNQEEEELSDFERQKAEFERLGLKFEIDIPYCRLVLLPRVARVCNRICYYYDRVTGKLERMESEHYDENGNITRGFTIHPEK